MTSAVGHPKGLRLNLKKSRKPLKQEGDMITTVSNSSGGEVEKGLFKRGVQPSGCEFDMLALEGGKSIHGESLQMAVTVIQVRGDDSLRINGNGHGERGSERSLEVRVHGNGDIRDRKRKMMLLPG